MYHYPEHYRADERPEFLEWLHARRLPPTADMLLEARARGTKWLPEIKPDQGPARAHAVMRMQPGDPPPRRRRARGAPRYVFGDDASDYFNQLVLLQCSPRIDIRPS